MIRLPSVESINVRCSYQNSDASYYSSVIVESKCDWMYVCCYMSVCASLSEIILNIVDG
jgi:hypothetical protein